MGELTRATFAGCEVGDAIRRDLVSTVYEAVEDDGRVVALRVVAEDLCAREGEDRELYRRFLHRAAAALTFDHPNAQRVEEVGEHRGRGYLITPHVETVPFDDYIAEHGPLEIEPALALFSQVADVLDAGHRAGLTHGAVNPTTLRIATSFDGPPTVHLTGFGIGALLELRLRHDRKQLRDVDELLYVAPEQLRRQPLTGRTDQYAMACALMHALTGEPPFVRDSVGGLFGAHLFVTPTVADGGDSEAAILKALAKQPRERYATCTQLLSDVTRAGKRAVNRQRADRRRRGLAAHSWLSEAGVPTLAGAPTSTLDGEALPTVGSDDAGTRLSGNDVADDGDAATGDDASREGQPSPTAHPGLDASGATGAGARTHADGALSNGERSVPARAGAGATSVDDSWAADRQSTDMAYPEATDMAYPEAGDGPEPAPATESPEDLDDVPLLSEVLSRRPLRPERTARRLPAALLGLIILTVIATAIVLWFIVT